MLPDRPDLIVLPELCDRLAGRDDEPEYYLARGNRVRDALAELAAAHVCYLTYPAQRLDADSRWRNSLQLIGRDGTILGTYDKNHLTIDEYEKRGTLYGTEAQVFELDFGQVACVICFDLNFDGLLATYVAAEPDLLLFSSAYHGSFRQQQWAYSTGAYLPAAVYPPAPSAIISPVGHTIANTTNYHDEITARINLDRIVIHLDYHGKKLRDMKRKYGPEVYIHDPGLLGSVLLTSESDQRTVADLVEEFELESAAAYLGRALVHRSTHVEG
nr:carbon-nitrogen hydrolase family protein [Phytoactinopolyspora limicola]